MTTGFRLMTANLLHQSADAARFADQIDRLDPDVVVTQELGPDCAGVLVERYPNGRLLPAHDFRGRGIATRFDGEFGDIPMPVRTGTRALLNVEGILLRLAGMHLVNPVEFPWWRSLRVRREQLSALFEWAAAGDEDIPLVVAGDMNASPRWPAYRQMVGRWNDVVADHAAASDAGPERTWGWRPGWPRMLRIDHVYGRRVQASNAFVEPIAGSDHHAVVVDLEIPD